MILQLTLTVPQAKALIARAIISLPEVQHAQKEGRIFLKGGTTVSGISEAMGGPSMLISGRLSYGGARTAKRRRDLEGFHYLILEKDEFKTVDNELEKFIRSLKPGDIIITGANAIDSHGNAALMAGVYSGGRLLRHLFFAAWSEGIQTIIACGIEKLVPGDLRDAIQRAGRKRIDRAYGMSVGLIPLMGRIFTEVDAIKTLANVDVVVIGAGGINGAEGSTTLLVEGKDDEVMRIDALYQEIRRAITSGSAESLIECHRGEAACADHYACVFKTGEVE